VKPNLRIFLSSYFFQFTVEEMKICFFLQEEVVEEVEEAVVHEDNDWGISLVSEDAGETDASVPTLVAGITVAYSRRAQGTTDEDEEEPGTGADETSLEDLMKQMKSM